MYGIQFLGASGIEFFDGQGEEVFFGNGIATLTFVTFHVRTWAHQSFPRISAMAPL